MKNIRNLFKDKDFLLDEPEVEELLDYCEQLQDEIVEFNYQKNNNKELAMKDMLTEILKACTEAQKQQALNFVNTIRFNDKLGYQNQLNR